ncbi:MAG: IPT/TIG domain-containing protein, partial [Acidobacteriota bacterium]
MATSGDTVVVGAPSEASNATGVDGTQNNNSATFAGAAYVFVRSSGTTYWSQQAYLKASNTGSGDFFCFSVAISGDTVVVGAYGEDSNATGVNGTQGDNSASTAGAAYVFTLHPEVSALSPSSGPLAGGQSVTITGTNFTGATAVTIGGAAVTSFT